MNVSSSAGVLAVACMITSLGPADAPETAKPDVVQVIGYYSQIKQTSEHAYGYVLRLWRDGESVHGLWARSDGRPADFPAVLTTVLHFDESTGRLRFTAQWCDETESFEGVLKGETIVGEVVRTSRAGSEIKKLRLRKSEDEEAGPRSRVEWTDLIEQILKTRGPKC